MTGSHEVSGSKARILGGASRHFRPVAETKENPKAHEGGVSRRSIPLISTNKKDIRKDVLYDSSRRTLW